MVPNTRTGTRRGPCRRKPPAGAYSPDRAISQRSRSLVRRGPSLHRPYPASYPPQPRRVEPGAVVETDQLQPAVIVDQGREVALVPAVDPAGSVDLRPTTGLHLVDGQGRIVGSCVMSWRPV